MERLNCVIKDILSAWLDGNNTNNCSSDLVFVVDRRRDDPENIIGVIFNKSEETYMYKIGVKALFPLLIRSTRSTRLPQCPD